MEAEVKVGIDGGLYVVMSSESISKLEEMGFEIEVYSFGNFSNAIRISGRPVPEFPIDEV